MERNLYFQISFDSIDAVVIKKVFVGSALDLARPQKIRESVNENLFISSKANGGGNSIGHFCLDYGDDSDERRAVSIKDSVHANTIARWPNMAREKSKKIHAMLGNNYGGADLIIFGTKSVLRLGKNYFDNARARASI